MGSSAAPSRPRVFCAPSRLLLALGSAAVLLLWACGGGGGGGAAAPPPPPPLPAPKPPAIDGFAPTKATAYTEIRVTGSGFTGTTQVTLGGVPITSGFVVSDDRTLLLVVPARGQNGPLRVTTALGTATSADSFTFEPGPPAPPRITLIVPSKGPVGSLVTVSGEGLLSVQAVDFGGVPAVLPTPVSDNELRVVVPPGAVTGPITVTGPTGLKAASADFEVGGITPGAPVISDYQPKAGGPGTTILVTGANLSQVTAISIGGSPVDSGHFRILGDDSIELWLTYVAPLSSGPLIVQSPSGSATHPVPFSLAGGPTLTRFEPPSAAPGDTISLIGTGLAKPTLVTFAGQEAEVAGSTETEIRVLVPDGATGLSEVRVVTAAGGVVAPGPFAVNENPGPVQVAIEGMTAVQATQANPSQAQVPLVAGRDAMVRVFLTANRNAPVKPTVFLRLTDAQGNLLDNLSSQASGGRVPVSMGLGNLARSWNFLLPGALVQPGLRLVATVPADPENGVGGDGLTFPADGTPLALEVQQVAPLGLTLIPVRSALGIEGRVTGAGRSLDSWVARLKAVLPLGQVDVEVGPVHNTNLFMRPDRSGDNTALRNELEALRLRNPGNRRYWYGVYRRQAGSGEQGLGNFPDSPGSNLKRTAVGIDEDGFQDGDNYPEILAHELGHLLNLRHAPCSAPGPDPKYPYTGGSIGALGVDIGSAKLFDPELFFDFMGYCSPTWVSDYNFKKTLDFRKAELPFAAADQVAAATPGLLVRGLLSEGTLTLNPAFEVPGVSSQPAPGPYLLQVLDAAGAVLQETPFDLPPEPDPGPGPEVRGFVFAVPFTEAMRSGMASLRVLLGTRVLAVRGGAGAGPGARLTVAPRDPVAVAWRPGIVRLSWDPVAYPQVIVRDLASGQDIGLGSTGALELATAARDLELSLSDGLRTSVRRLQVQD